MSDMSFTPKEKAVMMNVVIWLLIIAVIVLFFIHVAPLLLGPVGAGLLALLCLLLLHRAVTP